MLNTRCRNFIFSLRRNILLKTLLNIILDSAITFCAFFAALAIRLDLTPRVWEELETFKFILPIAVALSSLVGLYRISIIHADDRLPKVLIMHCLCGSFIMFSLNISGYYFEIPRSVPILFEIFFVILHLLIRKIIKNVLVKTFGKGKSAKTDSIVIITDGNWIWHMSWVLEITQTHAKRCLTNLAALVGSRFGGAIVESLDHYQNPDMIPNLVLGTLDSKTEAKLAGEVFEMGAADKFPFTEILFKHKKVDPSNVLARNQNNAHASAFDRSFKLGNVVVSGGGGSIGSELVKQLLAGGVNHVLVLDSSEFNLFKLRSEIEPEHRNRVSYLDVDVTNEEMLKDVFERYRPTHVYHAAAKKHVESVEDNRLTGFRTNVYGTYLIANMCRAFDVDRMVLISSDKAVRPTNIMGATKQMAELIVLAVASQGKQEATRTKFSCVRFGNVLGSSGSVLNIFSHQVETNKPLTVTDQKATRYFMLIEEAVSLVILSSQQNTDSHFPTYVLNMGDPIRIYDLAVQVKQMMGRSDLPIQIIGLKSGEKLHEELLLNPKNAELIERKLYRTFGEFDNVDMLAVQSFIDRMVDAFIGRDLEAQQNLVREMLVSKVVGYKNEKT